jgi:hypothetical protein
LLELQYILSGERKTSRRKRRGRGTVAMGREGEKPL